MSYVSGAEFFNGYQKMDGIGALRRPDRASAPGQFVKFFYAEMVKQGITGGSGIYSNENENLFGKNKALLSDIFASRLAEEIVKSGKYDELVAKSMFGRASSKF